MKKISILLAAVLIIAFLIGAPVLAYADTGETNPPIGNEEGETVEVPKDVWEEILGLLEKIKDAQSGEDVKDIVEQTFGARFKEWFGDWGDLVLLIVTALFVGIFTAVNKKSSTSILAGVGTVYKTTKTLRKKITKKDEDEEDKPLDEIITASADKSSAAEKMSKAALEMIKLLVLQSNAKETVKAEAEKLYIEATKEEV